MISLLMQMMEICICSHRHCIVRFLCTEKTSLKMLELLMHQQPGKSLKRIARKSQILGEIPVIVGGSDAWQLMRYLSFSPWSNRS